MTRAHGLTAADVALMPSPLAHVSGLLNAVLVPGDRGHGGGAHGEVGRRTRRATWPASTGSAS